MSGRAAVRQQRRIMKALLISGRDREAIKKPIPNEKRVSTMTKMVDFLVGLPNFLVSVFKWGFQ